MRTLAASNQFGIPNQTDVFSVEKGGTLSVFSITGNGAWEGPRPISAKDFFTSDTAVAASDQFGLTNQTDVFAIDRKGTLSVFWINNKNTWNGPLSIETSTGLFPPGAAVAASKQFGLPNQTDVFAIDKDGRLRGFWITGNAPDWKGPISVSETGLFPPGGAVAASNQFGIPNQTDVFAIDKSGALKGFWITGNAPDWKGPHPVSTTGLFPPGGAVAASNRFGVPEQTDVFAIDKNGTLNVFWITGNEPNWNGPRHIGQAGLFPPGGAVAVSNQFGTPSQTDVFAIDKNGTLNVFWITGNEPNWNGPLSIGKAGSFPPGGAVVASNQFGTPNQTDVFATDKDGILRVAWITGNEPALQGPVSIP
jgi:hypothetical protein